MYAVNALNLADASSVARYLRRIKSAHKELMFTTDDPRNMARRLNHLVNKGFLNKYLYVCGTGVDIDDAQAIYDVKRKESEKEFKENHDYVTPVFSLDDDYMDEESGEEISAIEYNTLEYSDYVDKKKGYHYMKRKNSYAVLNDIGNNIQEYFGEGSSLVVLYGIEKETIFYLQDRFGSNIPVSKGNSLVKIASEQIGDAAIGHTAAVFSELPSYHRMKQGKLVCKRGSFLVPVEMEFRVPREGEEYSYYCGIFKSYYNRAVGRTLEAHDKGRLHDTMNVIRNFVGTKGITKQNQDAFAIVVVDDLADLKMFANTAIKSNAFLDAELNRVFFTGEGILDSGIGAERVIRIIKEEDKVKFATVRLPIV
jgi:hypothetical protein